MATITHETRFDLEDRELLIIEEVRDATVTCLEGELWITKEGDNRDFVVRAGSSVELDARQRVFVSAFVSSSALLRQVDRQAPAAAMSRKLYATLVNWEMPKLFAVPATMLR